MGLINFVKTIWNNGGPPGISAQQLNRIENGIKALDDLTTATAQPNKLLTLNSQSKLPASITGDALTLQGKNANDFVLANRTSGFVAYDETIGANATLTKTIPIGSGKRFGNVLLKGTHTNTAWTGALVFLNEGESTFIVGSYNTSQAATHRGTAWSKSMLGTITSEVFGRQIVSTEPSCIVEDLYISGNNLVVIYRNGLNESRNMTTSVEWEVW